MNRSVPILSLAAILLAAGCTGSVPRATGKKRGHPGLRTERFAPASTKPSDQAAGWAGRYEGTGSVYTARTGGWQREERLELVVRADRPHFLAIEGIPLSRAGWAFAFDAELGDSGVLSGERISSDGSAKYEYSLARSHDRITGVLKRYQRGASGTLLQPPDEWVFEADRK